MNTKTKAAAYGIAGLAIAGIMIFSGTALGVLGPSSGLNLGSRGSLSILLTDPPTVPEGVTAVYVSYSSFSLHVEGLGDSGFVRVGTPGTVETLGLVNLSQTLTTADAPSGRYNLITFNITSVKVTFNGANYSATVNSGRLVVPIVGGLSVNASKPAAALIDIQPTILNLGNLSSPDFTMATGARALQFPPREVGDSETHVGFRTSLSDRGWFATFSAHSDNLTVGTLSLSSSSFSLSVSNPGSDSIALRMLILTPSTSGTRPGSPLASIADSIVLAVNPDGSLKLIAVGPGMRDNMGGVMSALDSDGFQLAAGASKTFTFSGAITTSLSGAGVSSGIQYYVVVMGSHALAIGSVTST